MWCFRLPLQHLTCTWSYMTMKDVIYYMYVKTSGAHVGDEWVRSSSLPGSCLKMRFSLLGIHQLSWISHPSSLFFGCSLWIVDYHGINMWEQKRTCWFKLSLLFMEVSNFQHWCPKILLELMNLETEECLALFQKNNSKRQDFSEIVMHGNCTGRLWDESTTKWVLCI